MGHPCSQRCYESCYQCEVKIFWDKTFILYSLGAAAPSPRREVPLETSALGLGRQAPSVGKSLRLQTGALGCKKAHY
jgi:hypothetical protein